MALTDASPHQWMKGLYCNLIIFVDDATSTIPVGLFVEQETTLSYMRAMEMYFRRFGLPEFLYTDKHSVFYASGGASNGFHTRYSLVLRQSFGVEIFHSNTPQARGRMERAHETNQGRLPMILTDEVYPRVAGFIEDRPRVMEECNRFLAEEYLPDYNRRFGAPPRSPEDSHQPLTSGQIRDLPSLMTEREVRKMDVNGMFHFDSKRWMLADGRQLSIYRKRKGPEVEIIRHWDGTVRYFCDGKELKIVEAGTQPKVPDAEEMGTKELAAKVRDHEGIPKKKPRPHVDSHPWREASFREMQRKKEERKNRRKI